MARLASRLKAVDNPSLIKTPSKFYGARSTLGCRECIYRPELPLAQSQIDDHRPGESNLIRSQVNAGRHQQSDHACSHWHRSYSRHDSLNPTSEHHHHFNNQELENAWSSLQLRGRSFTVHQPFKLFLVLFDPFLDIQDHVDR